MNLRATISTALISLIFAVVASAQSSDFESSWHNGFVVKSQDGRFSLLFGGRIHTDFTFFSYHSEMDGLFNG